MRGALLHVGVARQPCTLRPGCLLNLARAFRYNHINSGRIWRPDVKEHV